MGDRQTADETLSMMPKDTPANLDSSRLNTNRSEYMKDPEIFSRKVDVPKLPVDKIINKFSLDDLPGIS